MKTDMLIYTAVIFCRKYIYIYIYYIYIYIYFLNAEKLENYILLTGTVDIFFDTKLEVNARMTNNILFITRIGFTIFYSF